MSETEKRGKPIIKVALIGCGVVMLVATALVIWLAIWLFSGPEGGVKLANQMDEYALEYLDEHEVLGADEELIAYYDVTVSMDGTEAAILTTKRVVYLKAGMETAIALDEIEDVNHRYERFIGDVIEVQSRSGTAMKIEIAPFNQGETFLNALNTAWDKARTPNE